MLSLKCRSIAAADIYSGDPEVILAAVTSLILMVPTERCVFDASKINMQVFVALGRK